MTSLREYSDEIRTFTAQLDTPSAALETPERTQAFVTGYLLALEDLTRTWSLTPQWTMHTTLPNYQSHLLALQESLAQRAGLVPVGASAPAGSAAGAAQTDAVAIPETTMPGERGSSG
jgi:hypothetical protein